MYIKIYSVRLARTSVYIHSLPWELRHMYTVCAITRTGAYILIFTLFPVMYAICIPWEERELHGRLGDHVLGLAHCIAHCTGIAAGLRSRTSACRRFCRFCRFGDFGNVSGGRGGPPVADCERYAIRMAMAAMRGIPRSASQMSSCSGARKGGQSVRRSAVKL
jgi:hypothetical protein